MLPIAELRTCTTETFEKQYLPYFTAKGVKVKFIQTHKSFNKASGTVSIYEREVKGYKHTFIERDHKVYLLTGNLQPTDFRTIGNNSPVWKGPFSIENFGAVTPELIVDKPGSYDEKPSGPTVHDQDDPGQGFSFDSILGFPVKPLPQATEESLVIASTDSAPEINNVKPLYPEAPKPKADLSTLEGFDQFIDGQLATLRHILVVKGAEYVRGNSRFSNFERTAAIRGNTPEEALQGFLDKHLTNYFDMLDDIKLGKIHSEAAINERFGDIVIYFLIQHAQFLRRFQRSQTTPVALNQAA